MKRLHFLEMNKDEAQADDVEPVEQFPVMAGELANLLKDLTAVLTGEVTHSEKWPKQSKVALRPRCLKAKVARRPSRSGEFAILALRFLHGFRLELLGGHVQLDEQSPAGEQQCGGGDDARGVR